MTERVISVARKLIGSPSVRVAALFAAFGVGFAGGNLLLARALTQEEYGLVALWLALYYLGGALAPWGADGVVNRRYVRPNRVLLRRVLLSSLVTAAVLTGGAAIAYPFTPGLLGLLFLAIVAGGLAVVAAAQFQARQRFITAMMVWQGSNLLLVLAAVLSLALGGRGGGSLPVAVVTMGTATLATVGWLRLRRVAAEEAGASTAADPGPDGTVSWWRESLSYFLGASTNDLLPQVERLVIPRVLSLVDLATFGVLAALVIAPYRMLQSGIGFTLFPRMSQAETRRARRRLLVEEVRLMLVGAAVALVAVWYLAPLVTRVFLADKYELAPSLVLAGIVTGMVKMLSSLGRALVFALGTPRDLGVYGAASWVALAAAAAGAWYGARWGVEGVIYGTAAAVLLQATAALVLSFRHLAGKQPTDDSDRG